ncbi:hypothetical protein PRZ48_010734 [Zasmidium cellare]|uniref:Fungal lipase-type domain-containing protein n=1 Tax=Zasmidium cellare TaxID=395010 RepID=A0ABR0E9H1_ZASCE|nr:hypothetical protein PRZ48_010734 [Zasmidium cellare]
MATFLDLMRGLVDGGISRQDQDSDHFHDVSSSLHDVFVRITKYAAASYASQCAMPPNNSTVIRYFNNASTDTQATLFRDDTRKELVIAFRGTSDLQDFTSDFAQTLVQFVALGISDCPDCKVHNGTLTAWNSVSNDVLSTMQAQLSSFPGYKPIVTGHSLGGAIASVASASLVHFFSNLTTYTFGQFRTGNPAYAAYVDRILPYPNLYRVTHLNDGVPQTIHRSSGYAHHSREHWELEPFGPSNTYKCTPGDDEECNQSTLGLGVGGVGTPEGINGAHLCYSGILIGNPLDAGASSCNGASLLPQNCSSGTLGGIV